MKYLTVTLTAKAYQDLVNEAKKKGTTPAALASTKVALYPKTHA